MEDIDINILHKIVENNLHATPDFYVPNDIYIDVETNSLDINFTIRYRGVYVITFREYDPNFHLNEREEIYTVASVYEVYQTIDRITFNLRPRPLY